MWRRLVARYLFWQRSAAHHAAALLGALSIGWGAAVTFGIDRVAVRERRLEQQTGRTLELARCAPEHSLILLGGYALDEVMALHDQREILFINVGMGPRNGSNARSLVEQALRPGRAAYLVQDSPEGNWHFAWPGFAFERRPECPRVWKIVRTPAS